MFITGVLCTVCGAQVYFGLFSPQIWPPWTLDLMRHIRLFSNNEWILIKLILQEESTDVLNVPYQVDIFQANKSTKMAALDSD